MHKSLAFKEARWKILVTFALVFILFVFSGGESLISCKQRGIRQWEMSFVVVISEFSVVPAFFNVNWRPRPPFSILV